MRAKRESGSQVHRALSGRNPLKRRGKKEKRIMQRRDKVKGRQSFCKRAHTFSGGMGMALMGNEAKEASSEG